MTHEQFTYHQFEDYELLNAEHKYMLDTKQIHQNLL